MFFAENDDRSFKGILCAGHGADEVLNLDYQFLLHSDPNLDVIGPILQVGKPAQRN